MISHEWAVLLLSIRVGGSKKRYNAVRTTHRTRPSSRDFFHHKLFQANDITNTLIQLSFSLFPNWFRVYQLLSLINPSPSKSGRTTTSTRGSVATYSLNSFIARAIFCCHWSSEYGFELEFSATNPRDRTIISMHEDFEPSLIPGKWI